MNSQTTFIALPPRPPNISVVSRHPSPDDGCGEVMILNCTANSAKNLLTQPMITWIAPNGNEVAAGRGSNPTVDPQTRQLIFSDITTTNRGIYMCRAVINIPEAQIVNHIDEATVTVSMNGGCLYIIVICF